MHGGKSTGPRTAEGKARAAAAHWKHGRRSKAYVDARKWIWSELRRVENEMRKNKFLAGFVLSVVAGTILFNGSWAWDVCSAGLQV